MKQDVINLIPRVKELYSRGENIIQYLRSRDGRNLNTIEDILISYDFQAGSYIKFANSNPEYIEAYSSAIAKVLRSLTPFRTILEVGVGEATTLANVAMKLNSNTSPEDNEVFKMLGFDISWSRIKCGTDYLIDKHVAAKLFVADLFNIPFNDNSIDVVYTSHSIEPNGGREKEALIELYRVARKYLVLLEPTDEFANDEGKNRIMKNGYVQNLRAHISELRYKLIEYRPFEVSANPLNPTGLYVISKEATTESHEPIFSCPISRGILTEHADHFFSTESLISYPKVQGIPCLSPNYGILTTKHQ